MAEETTGVPMGQLCEDMAAGVASYLASKFPQAPIGFTLVLFADHETVYASNANQQDAFKRLLHLVEHWGKLTPGSLDKPTKPDTLPPTQVE